MKTPSPGNRGARCEAATLLWRLEDTQSLRHLVQGLDNMRDMKRLLYGGMVTVLLAGCGESMATAPGGHTGGGEGAAATLPDP